MSATTTPAEKRNLSPHRIVAFHVFASFAANQNRSKLFHYPSAALYSTRKVIIFSMQ